MLAKWNYESVVLRLLDYFLFLDGREGCEHSNEGACSVPLRVYWVNVFMCPLILVWLICADRIYEAYHRDWAERLQTARDREIRDDHECDDDDPPACKPRSVFEAVRAAPESLLRHNSPLFKFRAVWYYPAYVLGLVTRRLGVFGAGLSSCRGATRLMVLLNSLVRRARRRGNYFEERLQVQEVAASALPHPRHLVTSTIIGAVISWYLIVFNDAYLGGYSPHEHALFNSSTPLNAPGAPPRFELLEEVYPIHIAFRNLTCHVPGVERPVLHQVTGEISPGRVTAILGPSGAGKSTFTQMLLGSMSQCVVDSGDVYLNGKKRSLEAVLDRVGYVPQQDELYAHLTVAEMLQFSALLRLPKTVTTQQVDQAVNETIALLDLQHVRDSKIGSVHERSLSGGEKKRVSIGIELIAQPSVLVMDEPTTGLDSANANQLMKYLHKIAQRGVSVVAVLHLPSMRQFSRIQDVLLLKDGECVYTGPRVDLPGYLRNLGFKAPCAGECDAGVAVAQRGGLSGFGRRTDDGAAKDVEGSATSLNVDGSATSLNVDGSDPSSNARASDPSSNVRASEPSSNANLIPENCDNSSTTAPHRAPPTPIVEFVFDVLAETEEFPPGVAMQTNHFQHRRIHDQTHGVPTLADHWKVYEFRHGLWNHLSWHAEPKSRMLQRSPYSMQVSCGGGGGGENSTGIVERENETMGGDCHRSTHLLSSLNLDSCLELGNPARTNLCNIVARVWQHETSFPVVNKPGLYFQIQVWSVFHLRMRVRQRMLMREYPFVAMLGVFGGWVRSYCDEWPKVAIANLVASIALCTLGVFVTISNDNIGPVLRTIKAGSSVSAYHLSVNLLEYTHHLINSHVFGFWEYLVVAMRTGRGRQWSWAGAHKYLERVFIMYLMVMVSSSIGSLVCVGTKHNFSHAFLVSVVVVVTLHVFSLFTPNHRQINCDSAILGKYSIKWLILFLTGLSPVRHFLELMFIVEPTDEHHSPRKFTMKYFGYKMENMTRRIGILFIFHNTINLIREFAFAALHLSQFHSLYESPLLVFYFGKVIMVYFMCLFGAVLCHEAPFALVGWWDAWHLRL